jgi:hypothetical protein
LVVFIDVPVLSPGRPPKEACSSDSDNSTSYLLSVQSPHHMQAADEPMPDASFTYVMCEPPVPSAMAGRILYTMRRVVATGGWRPRNDKSSI